MIAKRLATSAWVLLCAPYLVSGAITDRFVVQGVDNGQTKSSCAGDKLDQLNNYLTDSVTSLKIAIDAVGSYFADDDDGELRVQEIRQAMFTFFNIPIVSEQTPEQEALVNSVHALLDPAYEFLNGANTNIPKSRAYLFCGSDWLVAKAADDEAQDNEGDIIMKDDEPVTIEEIPDFKSKLDNGLTAWWAGQYSDPALNGYYFAGTTNDGGNYCNDKKNLGLTSTLDHLDSKGNAALTGADERYTTMILCPSSFGTNRYETYAAGAANIAAGKSLQTFLPRSATLAHEAFHVVHGTNMFEGTAEKYLLAQCRALAKGSTEEALSNPESFVFFTAAMFYLLANEDEGIPKSAQGWDFTKTPTRAKQIEATSSDPE